MNKYGMEFDLINKREYKDQMEKSYNSLSELYHGHLQFMDNMEMEMEYYAEVMQDLWNKLEVVKKEIKELCGKFTKEELVEIYKEYKRRNK